MSEIQFATLLFAAPFLILSIIWSIGLVVLGEH